MGVVMERLHGQVAFHGVRGRRGLADALKVQFEREHCYPRCQSWASSYPIVLLTDLGLDIKRSLRCWYIRGVRLLHSTQCTCRARKSRTHLVELYIPYCEKTLPDIISKQNEKYAIGVEGATQNPGGFPASFRLFTSPVQPTRPSQSLDHSIGAFLLPLRPGMGSTPLKL